MFFERWKGDFAYEKEKFIISGSVLHNADIHDDCECICGCSEYYTGK